jgi:hypothetical protein
MLGTLKYPPAKPGALFYEPLIAAGKEFSESASGSVPQSEVAIGFQPPMPDSDRDTDADSDL